jgi:hypothetical protein
MTAACGSGAEDHRREVATKDHKDRIENVCDKVWKSDSDEIDSNGCVVLCDLWVLLWQKCFQSRSGSWLPGFLLKNDRSGIKKEAMNPGKGQAIQGRAST